jgi:integrase
VAQSLLAIRTVFNAARRQGLISINPAEAVELPRNLKPVRRGTFSTVQIKLLLKAAADDTEWQTAILFGYCTGLRLGDATSRDWADVDFLAGKLKFTTGKTGKLQVNPLTPDLHAHLSRLAGDKGGPICPRLAETRPDGRNGLTNQFFAIMKRAGIDKQAVNSGGRRTLATLSFHSLRKSYNSALAVQGVSQELRRKLVGHRSDRVNDLYTAEDFAALKKAVKTLPQLDPWLPGLEG